MIAIIDYGMGNLRSVQKAFETVGQQAVVTRSAQVIRDASHVVLPGVGAFPDCIRNLEQYDLVQPVHQAIRSGKPFLGICLGLQLLFTESEEFGLHKGLGILAGRVVRFPRDTSAAVTGAGQAAGPLKVPHMGWNDLTIARAAPPLRDLETGARVYFVHSYYVVPDDAGVTATTTDYGVTFVSSIWHDNVFACQFHPEKSQAIGLHIVKNFGAWR
jgi:glutamine amidotransferase